MKKFRAWDEELGFMVDPSYYFVSLDGSVWFNNCQDGEDELIEQTFKLKVMEYIGRNDDNGNEICTGDIVRISNPKQYVQSVELNGEVRYSDWGSYKICNIKTIKWEKFSFGVNPPEYMWFLNLGDKKIEIIGNIYENPELIA
jgi:uncharacterized phage protein (TIGR01671 family)